jgi:two-component system alkaline phosphatase synthesis response regulator PhoP
MDKKKILVADDELSVRSLVRQLLNKDYIVIEATNGKEAVDIAKGQKPDLILMDLMMPEIDGYAACSIIKADRATQLIPVVMLTGVGHELNKKLAQRIGASGYITKPFQLQDLLDAIGKFS